jgi:uncharacterized protein YdeI (YjbR/CyaY-like superfamily)
MSTPSTTTNFLHELPTDLEKIISSSVELKNAWDKLTTLGRNEWICWITIVKKAETKQEHIERFQVELLEGKKRPCCWPGCPHRRPNAQKWFVKKG